MWPWRQAVAELGGQASTLFDEPPDAASPEWFARCTAVVEHLRDLSAEGPCVVVLDDTHAADDATIRLAHFVARHVRALPLVPVVAHQPAPHLEALDREATEIPLHGLTAADVASMLAAGGIDDLSEPDVAFVVGVTRGLPLEIRRLAAHADHTRGAVRSLIDERLGKLPPDVLRVAVLAAVLGSFPLVRELVVLAADDDHHHVDPLAAVAELERAGLVTRRPPDALAFTHDDVRAELVATVQPADLLDANARIAAMLEAGSPALDQIHRRARHALAATRRSAEDARLAVQVAQEAAAALIAANDPRRARGLLTAAEKAYEDAGLGRPPAALLAARANAVLRCGCLNVANELYDRAAAAADEEGDAHSLGLAALGLGGVWLAEQRSLIDRERIFGLQRRARDGLPENAALRLRLAMRLAAEESYATGQLAHIEEHVAAARAFGDPSILAEALSLYHHTVLGPEHRDLRERIAHEMVTVAAAADDNLLSLMAQLWLTTDLFLAGEAQAERSLRELRQRADKLAGRHIAYIARVMDVMLLQRAGRFDDAEEAANEALSIGLDVGDADAIAYYGSQLAAQRWIQGRAAEVLELAADTAASPTITPSNHAFTGVFASLAAECGEHDRARAALTRLRGRLRSIPQNSAWLATLFSTVEAAHRVGDVEIAREAIALLEPYADVPVLGSLAVVCLGSTRRTIGLAMVTIGDLDKGIALLEAAVADNERLGNRPLTALTVADLARVRSERGRDDDRAAAIDLLDRAIREADAMQLTIRLAEWRTLRESIGATRVSRANSDVAATIDHHGSSWVLNIDDCSIVVPDLLDMRYLARLLTNPRVEIAAATLVIDAGDTPAALAVRDEQPMLDPAALPAYRRRVTELEDDLAEAEHNADTERAAQTRVELDAIVDELTRTTNRFGKARPFASSNERARTAVQKAVRRVLDHIEGVDAKFGAALRASVQTGRTCSYQPGPGAPERWNDVSR